MLLILSSIFYPDDGGSSSYISTNTPQDTVVFILILSFHFICVVHVRFKLSVMPLQLVLKDADQYASENIPSHKTFPLVVLATDVNII